MKRESDTARKQRQQRETYDLMMREKRAREAAAGPIAPVDDDLEIPSYLKRLAT